MTMISVDFPHLLHEVEVVDVQRWRGPEVRAVDLLTPERAVLISEDRVHVLSPEKEHAWIMRYN